MTLHSAKGLEFPEVYLVGMEDGLFPSYMAISGDDPTEVEEERRLCYVGITRAMEKLTLTCARRRMMHGEVQYNKMSQFLKEIPPELLATKGMVLGEEDKASKRDSYVHATQAFRSQAFAAVKPSQNFGVKSGTGPDYEVGDRVKHMIERQKERYGWEFLFIGANIDAVETAARYGIDKDRAVNYNPDGQGTQILYESVSKAVCSIRNCDEVCEDWSEEINADFQKRGKKF